jgi:hypothetical protein
MTLPSVSRIVGQVRESGVLFLSGVHDAPWRMEEPASKTVRAVGKNLLNMCTFVASRID